MFRKDLIELLHKPGKCPHCRETWIAESRVEVGGKR